MLAILVHTLYRIKEPAFLLLVLVGCVISWFCRGMDTLAINFSSDFGQQGGLLVGTAVVLCFGVIVSLLVGATEIPRDIDTNMIAILLGKPIERWSYLWGKILGVAILSLGSSVFWVSLLLITRYAFPGFEESAPMDVNEVLQQYGSLLLLLPVCAVAVGLSCIVGDLGSMIFSFLYFGFGVIAGIAPHIIRVVPPPINYILLIPYYMVPNVTYFLSSLGILSFLVLIIYSLTIMFGFSVLGRTVFDEMDI